MNEDPVRDKGEITVERTVPNTSSVSKHIGDLFRVKWIPFLRLGTPSAFGRVMIEGVALA